MYFTLFTLLQREFLIFFVQLSKVKVFSTMLNPEIDDISIPPQQFNLKNTKRNSENEIFEPYFEEGLDNNFNQFAFRFSNALNEMLAHENEDDEELESYKGEYDDDIEAELELDGNNDDEHEEEKDEIIPNNTDSGFASKLNIQASISPLTPCVIIDNIQGTIKRCGETYKLRKIRNLYGTWQIDRDAVQQVNNDYLKLGVCDSHFLYDQNQIHNPKDKISKEFTISDAIIQHQRCIGCKKYVIFFSRGEGCSNHSWLVNGRNIQIPCNGLVYCSALRETFISEHSLKTKKPRCICCTCYEQLGGHIHKRTGRGKKSNCDKLHEQDATKGINFIANWLIKISHIGEDLKKKEILNSIVKAILPFLPTSLIKTTLSSSTKSNETLSFFLVQTIFLDTFVHNKPQDIDIETIDCENLGRKFGIKLWKSRKETNEKKDLLSSPGSLFEYYHAFPNFITEFFWGMLMEIFKRKLAVSNRKRKQRGQIMKTLSENTVTKIVTFFVSVLTGIAFPSCDIWLTNVLSSLARKPKLLSSLHHLLTLWNVI